METLKNNLPKTVMILDTEFVGNSNKLIYDLGYLVCQLDESGIYQVIYKNNSIIKQVYDNRELFNTSYYNDKRKKYISLLKGRKAKRQYIGHAINKMINIIDKYDVEAILAYNSTADVMAFENTTSFYNLNNPLDLVKIFDLRPICTPLFESKGYKEFVEKNKFITENGYASTTVENACKYIYGNVEFTENHTALSDCYNELDLLNVSIKMGAEIKQYKTPFIETETLKPLTIVIENTDKSYTFYYKTKRTFKKENKIVLKK